MEKFSEYAVPMLLHWPVYFQKTQSPESLCHDAKILNKLLSLRAVFCNLFTSIS